MSNLNIDNVTVSMSRLALAKAIKTPDEGDTNTEPWTRSVIFHQSHVSDSMRQSMLYPGQSRPQRQQRPMTKQYDHVRPQRRRSRSSSQVLDHHYPPQDQQQYQHQHPQQQQQQHNPSSHHHHQQHAQLQHQTQNYHQQIQQYRNGSPQPNRQSDVSSPLALSQEKGKVNEANRRHHVAMSDDEEDDEDEESSDDDDEEQKPKAAPALVPAPPTPTPRKSLSAQLLSNNHQSKRVSQHVPEPSDDEEDEDDNNSRNSEDDDPEGDGPIPAQQAAPTPVADDMMQARRMSTLRQLERGPSVHKRSRSFGDLGLIQQETMDASNSSNNNLYAEGEVNLEQTGKLGVIERWRQDVSYDSFESRPSSSQSLGEEAGYQRRRRTTMGEMDAVYNQMQQQQIQQQMQWQMQQQAAQLQQMAQIQQYQQQAAVAAAAVMMPHQQQQQQQVTGSLNPNRRSMSAMDFLTQIEKEKEESRLKPKSKQRINPSQANLDSGLMGRMPPKNTHSLSFQQLQQSGDLNRVKMRASRSDLNLPVAPQPRRSRSPGPENALRVENGSSNKPRNSRMLTSTDARRRSEMMRNDPVPHVTPSLSTPTNRQSMMPTSQSMYGQYLVPMQPMMVPNQMMAPPTQFAPSMSASRPTSTMMGGPWAGNNNPGSRNNGNFR